MPRRPGSSADPPQRAAFDQVTATDYEFRIKGRLSDTLCGEFEDFSAAVQPAETVMRGEVRDQSELHGLLDRIQSLGLELLEVRRVPRRPND
jgi:hypothetical protein